MQIVNAKRFTAEELQKEADRGSKFVYYPYVISLILGSVRRNSGIYLVRKGENAAKKAIPYIILSSLFGWWAIPFGPKHAWKAIRTNWKGGTDVSDEVTATVAGILLFRESQRDKKTA
jgi:hypothetical protein